jgi:hypothetical protein
VSTAGNITLRIAGRLRHIGVGRTYARTRVILFVQDLHVRVINAATGELLRELNINPATTNPNTPNETAEPTKRRSRLSGMSRDITLSG